MDQEDNEIPLQTDLDHPFEIIIPRDPSLIIPPMSRENVTDYQGFSFHSVDLTPTSSIHLEMHPLNINLSFTFIYRFDRAPVLNASRPEIDGWAIFSPSSNTHFSRLDLSNESVYTYFLDNDQTSTHHSLVFVLRQLNDSSASSPWIDEGVASTADYEIRLYTSSSL